MGSIQWNDAVLGRIIGKAPEVVAEVERATGEMAERANSMSSDFRTGLYHRGETWAGEDDKKHKTHGVGHTQPRYVDDIEVKRNAVVGIVYTGNYAAMRDNHENNTLLKARG